MSLREKKEKAEEMLRNVEGQLEQLAAARQQLIGRIQTYNELLEETEVTVVAENEDSDSTEHVSNT